MPKTLSGKIRRVELRKREDEQRTADARGEHEYWEHDFPALEDAEAWSLVQAGSRAVTGIIEAVPARGRPACGQGVSPQPAPMTHWLRLRNHQPELQWK